MEQNELDDFLTGLYRSVSFAPGGFMDADAFARCFLPVAALFEWSGAAYVQKTVEAHVREMEAVVRGWPALFAKGFYERETGRDMVESDGVLLVASRYEKRYCRDGRDVLEHGINRLTLVSPAGALKIACAVW